MLPTRVGVNRGATRRCDLPTRMLPTRVGVNRLTLIAYSCCRMLPTRVGVNRVATRTATVASDMLPTRVGVNRTARISRDRAANAPHTCGGEPYEAQSDSTIQCRCSPHAWG